MSTRSHFGQNLFKQIIETIESGGVIRIDGKLVKIINIDEWRNNIENEVVYFVWDGDDGEEYNEKLTEDDLNNALIENGEIIIPDDRDMRVSLYRKYEVTP